MGAVHGVYLKYVGLSALSYAGYTYIMSYDTSSFDFSSSGVMDMNDMDMNDGLGAATAARILSESPKNTDGVPLSMWRLIPAAVLGYSTILNGLIAILFRVRKGMRLLGKDSTTGQIPLWSYVLYFPFHLPTMLYTYIHTQKGSYKTKTPTGETRREKVPVASEIQPSWWVGGCYAHQLDRDWAGIIDLTVEFPERCFTRCQSYLLLPTWDGVPATPQQLEEAAVFAVEARRKGDVLVHCAHGRGRSTTVMCACLVKAGIYGTWQDAFEKGVKPGRPVCKLNTKMRQSLTEWQRDYVDRKKGA